MVIAKNRKFIMVLVALSTLSGCFALNCHDCDSKSTLDCLKNVSNTKTTTCATEEKFCFAKTGSDGLVTRGCLNATVTECPGAACYTCDTENCNNNLVCKLCPSTADCVQVTDLESDYKYNRVCAANQPNCVKRVNDNQTISRGCGEAGVCGENKLTCETCSDPICNVGMYPANRLTCYQCSGADCNDLKATQAKPCALYSATDSCYTIGQSETDMQRGCYSDEGAKCSGATTDDPNCSGCNTNGCNNLKFKRSAVSCFKCSTNAACYGVQAENTTQTCPDISYAQPDGCYYQLVNGIASRGCLSERAADLGVCNSTNPNGPCTMCETMGCNGDKMDATFTCIRCRSDNFAGCRSMAKDIGGSPCDIESNDRKCFQGQWNDIVIRGCMSDADSLTQYQCNNNIHCTSCEGNNCNTKAMNAAACLWQPFYLQLALPLGLLLALMATKM